MSQTLVPASGGPDDSGATKLVHDKYDKYDLSDISTIQDRTVLAELLWAKKINWVDYTRADAVLRGIQPTPVDIRDVKVIFPDDSPSIISPQDGASPLRRSSRSTASPTVDRISETMIVKRGNVATEAKTMMFIREHTRIPVPAVHLVFAACGVTYLVMEYVPGGDLQHLWPTLQVSEQQSVLSQIQQYIHELRAITPSSLTPGPPGGGVCHGGWFSENRDFKSHQDIVDFWNLKFIPYNINDNGNSTSEIPPNGSRFVADHPLVFSHCDIVPRNLILREGTVWMIDWEQAGWYPEYVEYACIASGEGDPTPRDWTEAMLSLIRNYDREHEMLCSIQWRIMIGFL